MSREIPFDIDEKCDECGAQGAYDFMGDCLCPKCYDMCTNDDNHPNEEAT